MSSCSCGNHHHHHLPIEGGQELALAQPLIAVEGRLICADMGQMMLALNLLPDHVAASRAEPGNLRFDLSQTDDPLIWSLNELFTDAGAFAAHRDRTAASRWGQDSGAITRDFHERTIQPRIRPEAAQDQTGIRAVHGRAFGGDAESRLVDRLRDDGDLTLSLVADANGQTIGHLALSPITAPDAGRPVLALAPVAVEPRLHGRGIGAALIRAAIEAVPGHIITVLGDPAYYARFGFRPVGWDSPYAGPALQALGDDLPRTLTIRHAPAFDAMDAH
ncbi:GNAT family N-acetyltransferase [Paracoccus sp. DMF-8]|uniref:GNAT family N-acetyltransferase n=1 Tax=Paracoccus sp. DMF-8 TaxID=3019445 RepID=UPI0023E88C1B|nr:GNAT family N-acetyltransferase [Paracoccus sp. DMF-8]MDF3606019.1 GNAT family N-acetyltransferase [Paracoccus sp. DMF-8]